MMTATLAAMVSSVHAMQQQQPTRPHPCHPQRQRQCPRLLLPEQQRKKKREEKKEKKERKKKKGWAGTHGYIKSLAALKYN